MVTIKNLTKSYGNTKALDNLSLTIPNGGVFGLLGVNDAGKTTLLSILNGLIKPDSGAVEVFGYNLLTQRSNIKRISSIIPQSLAFYEELSVRENLAFFASIQNASKESVQKAIAINNLEGFLDKKASFLSGGQKRRLNIAIGLLNEPKIIYFDEPTVGVDPKSRNEILDSIASYKAMGITVVYTSHYIEEIERICDEVAIIDKGGLIYQDKMENLLSNKCSDVVLIQTLYSPNLQKLALNLLDETTIQTKENEVCSVLELLEKNNIHVKKLHYGASNLEQFFLEVTQ